MQDETKEQIRDFIKSGKDAVSNAVKNSDESKRFFEKLSEKISDFTGHTTVENKELTYNKNYDPEGEEES